MDDISARARSDLTAARERLAAGDLEMAEQLFSRLVHANPSPGAFAGFASVAMRRWGWTEALARWDDAIARFPQNVQIGWRSGRARALLQLGQHHDASAEFLRVLEMDPALPDAQRGLFNGLIATGQHDRGMHELDQGVFCGMESTILLYYRSALLYGRSKYGPARDAFRKALDSAEDPADFLPLILTLPRLHDEPTKRDLRLEILARMDGVPASDPRHMEFAMLRLRVLFALGEHEAYLAAIETIGAAAVRERPLGETFLSIANKLLHPDAAPTKVFVIGLSKTGTTSLAAALTVLGFNTADWSDPLTGDLLSFDSANFYDALSDTPISAEFERLAEAYPDAAFIYTTRPVADWERSYIAHHHRVYGWPDFATTRATAPGLREEFSRRAARIQQDLFLQYETLPEAYAVYDNRVRQYFSRLRAPRMLEFNVFAGDSWGELCSFLDKPIPGKPYPQQNMAPKPPMAS